MTQSLSISMLQAAREGSRVVLDLVLPPACRLCHAAVDGSDDFCPGCERALRLSETTMRQTCWICGMPQACSGLAADGMAAGGMAGDGPGSSAPDSSGPASVGPITSGNPAAAAANCVHCRGRGFALDRVVALWAYQGRVRDAIVAAKYPQQAALGHALGRRLATLVHQRLGTDLPDLVTFVPSHLTRRLSRGGIGTAVIAAAVARELGRPCRAVLKTTRPVAKQAWLDDSQRLRNVRGAFVAKRSYAFPRTPQLHNRHILVVDDVLTTGATANEVAKVLRGSGVKRVSLAVVARAIRSSQPLAMP